MVSGQGSLTSECHCCVIAQLVTDFGTSLEVTEDVDRYVVVISGSGLDGLVVVPRQHIGGLEDLPAAYRACILATLRRATQSLQERNPGSATRIVALTDLPSSKGHVCFRVVVKGPEEDQYTSETRAGIPRVASKPVKRAGSPLPRRPSIGTESPARALSGQ